MRSFSVFTFIVAVFVGAAPAYAAAPSCDFAKCMSICRGGEDWNIAAPECAAGSFPSVRGWCRDRNGHGAVQFAPVLVALASTNESNLTRAHEVPAPT